MNSTDYYSTFAKEGGRIGSGAVGCGQGGVARCVC
jgi:sulfate adenylyltransferase subunit 1